MNTLSTTSTITTRGLMAQRVQEIALSDTAQRVQFIGTIDKHSPSLDMHNILRKHGFIFSASSASKGNCWVTEFIREEPLSDKVFANMLNRLGKAFRQVSLPDSINK